VDRRDGRGAGRDGQRESSAAADDPSPQAAARRDRAGGLRPLLLALADEDVRSLRRGARGTGRPGALREALAAAADPPLCIARYGAEVWELAVAAAANARGGVRGEAVAAVALAGAAVAAAVPLVELNLRRACRPASERGGAELRRRRQSS